MTPGRGDVEGEDREAAAAAPSKLPYSASDRSHAASALARASST
jgi:hypothetical protein